MKAIPELLTTLEKYYRQHGRDLPWRHPEADGSFDPYKIPVSEVMLQQTQVSRVIPKFQEFLAIFPNLNSIASAPLSEVLQAWLGLGYNRRAKFLHEAAKNLATKSKPWTYEDLIASKGVGPNTAAAVMAYTYNSPVVFIETNIRTVIIHYCFQDQSDISDKEVLAKLNELISWKTDVASELKSSRLFYWAMMDYGSYLKASIGNPNAKSKHYAKQSKFQGSLRQIRGQVIRRLSEGPVRKADLAKAISDHRLPEVIDSLAREELVSIQDEMVMLYNS